MRSPVAKRIRKTQTIQIIEDTSEEDNQVSIRPRQPLVYNAKGDKGSDI
jgi:hypothetical protein